MSHDGSRVAARFIYIACPWTPVGGGMFKVADYLIQGQAAQVSSEFAQLRPLDTRGGSHAVLSVGVLALALCKLLWGRLTGRLAGVHVNMAERLSLFRKGIVVIFSRMIGVPVALHLHAAQLHHFYRTLPRLMQWWTRWVFSLPAVCIVLGNAAKRFVTEDLRVPADRVEVIINGVPEPTVTRRPEAAMHIGRVLFVGNLSQRKGVSDLLQALASGGFDPRRVQVSFAGGGDVESYRVAARQLGIDQWVAFEGWSEQAKVARLLAAADVLVLPSYDEGLPLVILEALANGVAVLCTPVGEIPDELTDGVTARFVQPGDIQGIARELKSILSSAQLRQALESNGRQLFEQRYSFERFFASLARIHRRYFGICGQGRVPDVH